MSDDQELAEAVARLGKLKQEMPSSGVKVSKIVRAVLGADSDEELESLVETAMASREGLPISDSDLVSGIISLQRWRTELV